MRDKPKYEKAYMECAEAFARASEAVRAKTGAVIVKDRAIISTGLNGTLPGAESNVCEEGDRTKDGVAHAEESAVLKSAREGRSTLGATMYCTHEPCTICARLIAGAGIKTVIYKHSYISKSHGSGAEFLKGHNVEVIKYE